MKANDTAGRRRGFTLVECAIVGALSMVVCGMAQAFSVSATASSNHTQSSEDATRAILLAAELIGHDVRRAIVATPADLTISADHHQATFQIAASRYVDWNAPFETVTYRLEPQPGGSEQRLVRIDSHGRRCPAGCILRGLTFQERPQVSPQQDPQAAATPWRTTVLVTLVAPLTDVDSRAVTFEIPVSRTAPPPAYPWFGPGGAP